MNSSEFMSRVGVCAVRKPWQAAGMALLLFCLPVFSQTNQGTIQGAIVDQSGGAVAGATVTVSDVAEASPNPGYR